MEVVVQPVSLTVRGSDVNKGEECNIVIRIVRGPLNWKSTRSYTIFAEDTTLAFQKEEFRKQSGLYFTKEGPEYKKASIKICKVVNEE